MLLGIKVNGRIPKLQSVLVPNKVLVDSYPHRTYIYKLRDLECILP